MKKENRIKKNEEFQSIIKHNKSKSNRYYVLYYANRKHDYDRIGISVGKKSGNAVVRNKIKRQVRMMLQELCDFNSGYDYILRIMISRNINKTKKNCHYYIIRFIINKDKLLRRRINNEKG